MNDRFMFYGASPVIFQFASKLRKNMTFTEKLLWDELKNNKLGVRFKAQHPIDTFIVDFYCHKYKLVVEIDGPIHNFHKAYDRGRTYELEQFGIKVLRFKNEEVAENLASVVKEIERVMEVLIRNEQGPPAP